MEKHVKTIEPNLKGRDFVVGDMHGCFKEFKHELFKLGFNEKYDRMFSVGDLCDRGPNSRECLDLLFEPWFHAVKGNHELLWYYAHTRATTGDQYIFLHNGGEMIPENEAEKYVKAIEDLPYLIEINLPDKRVGIIHVELPTNVTSWEHIKKLLRYSINPDAEVQLGYGGLAPLLWGSDRIQKFKRQQFKTRVYPEIREVDEIYVGHTIMPDPTIFEKIHYIDCGVFLPHWVSESKLKKMINKGIVHTPRLIVKEIR